MVDSADLNAWKVGFGTSGNAARIEGDADGDRDVDGEDFLIWQRQLDAGARSAVTSAPEPAGAVMLGIAFAVLLRRRTRV